MMKAGRYCIPETDWLVDLFVPVARAVVRRRPVREWLLQLLAPPLPVRPVLQFSYESVLSNVSCEDRVIETWRSRDDPVTVIREISHASQAGWREDSHAH